MFDGHIVHLLLAILLTWLLTISFPAGQNLPYAPLINNTLQIAPTPHEGWVCCGLTDSEHIGFADNITMVMTGTPWRPSYTARRVQLWKDGLSKLEFVLQDSQPCHACVSGRVSTIKCPYGDHRDRHYHKNMDSYYYNNMDYAPVCDADNHTDLPIVESWTLLDGSQTYVRIRDGPVVFSKVYETGQIFIAVYASGADITSIRLNILIRDLRPCSAIIRGEGVLHIECMRKTIGRMDLYLYDV